MCAPCITIRNDSHQCVNWNATVSCVWKWKWQTVVPTTHWADTPRASLLSLVVWYCDSSLRFSLRPFSLLSSYFLPGIFCTQRPMMSAWLSTCYGGRQGQGENHIIHNTGNGHGGQGSDRHRRNPASAVSHPSSRWGFATWVLYSSTKTQ